MLTGDKGFEAQAAMCQGVVFAHGADVILRNNRRTVNVSLKGRQKAERQVDSASGQAIERLIHPTHDGVYSSLRCNPGQFAQDGRQTNDLANVAHSKDE
ncbi:hypothetical protein D3C81_780080 [compost metagenome]